MNEVGLTTINLVLAVFWIAVIIAVLYFGIRLVQKVLKALASRH
jgi:hypothetical protein